MHYYFELIYASRSVKYSADLITLLIKLGLVISYSATTACFGGPKTPVSTWPYRRAPPRPLSAASQAASTRPHAARASGAVVL